MSTIKIRVLRAMLIGGRPVDAGAIVSLTPAAAADLLDCGDKAELLDPADRAVVNAGRRAEVTQQLGRRSMPSPGSPWRPAGWH